MDMKQIEEAREVLNGVISKTPIVKADKIHRNLYIKAENLQSTGAFKLRGAYYKLSKLSEAEKAKGVIAASAGNHAQGVAYACHDMNIKGTIVMPKSAPLSKIEATRSYGVEVVLQGDTFNDAYEYAQHLQLISGAIFIEPFNDEDIIAGQATIGLEIVEKMPEVECVIVPIGGGGLASGIAYAIKSLKPSCKVYGVEARNASSMKDSMEANKIITLDQVTTIADGIAVKAPGNITFDYCRKYLDGVVSVSEEEIAAAILMLVEKMKMVGEGAGASSVAAAMFHKVDIEDKKCVAVLSGGNIDVNFLSKIIDLGLVKTGRKAVLNLEVVDKPGNLSKVIELIGSTGANIVSVNHNRIFENALFNKCRVGLVIETFNHEHIDLMIQKLKENGYDPKVVTDKINEHLD
ncbi:MAG: threonine ammonia-lyase [Erysipelotrichaceae bacterium]